MKLPRISASKRSGLAKRAFTTLFLVMGVGSQPSVLAQESGWGLGIATISNQKAYTDIDRDTLLIPIITYENDYVRWFGPELDFKLPGLAISDTQQIDFSISAGYDLDGYDKDETRDTPILQGMDERDGVATAGAKVRWTSPWIEVGATWKTDISGDRDSSRFSIGAERNWMFGQHVIITPHVEVKWVDDAYVDYHYGVQAQEVRIDRPAYIGESTVNIEYGIRGAYMFNKHHSVFVDVNVTSLGDEIKDSPLVDSSTENSMMFFYLYSF